MDKISSKHFMILILAVTTIAIRSYASIFIKYGGRDSWLISIFSTIAIFIYLYLLLKICIKTNTYDINIIFNNSINKYIGSILKFLFAAGLFLISIESSCIETSSIHSNYFLNTPVWYCLIFFLIPACYVINKNFNSILIVTTIIVFLNVLGDIIILILVGKYLNLNNLLPIFRSTTYAEKFKCFLLITGSLSSVAICLPYLKFLKKPHSLITDSFFALLIAGFFITISLGALISFFGADRAANIFYPEYIECQRVKIANFLEFGELFFIFRSICMWFLKYILSYYGIILLYKDRIKNNITFSMCYCVLIFIISYLITKNQYILFSTLGILQIVILFTFIFIPLISFIAYYNKKK